MLSQMRDPLSGEINSQIDHLVLPRVRMCRARWNPSYPSYSFVTFRWGVLMIIGITGLAGSGKDTFCKLYQEKHPSYQRIGFADAIRNALVVLDPIVECGSTLSEIVQRKGWDVAKRENFEVRRLLQVFGTEVGRKLFGENVWTKKVCSHIRNSGHSDWIIPDVRFENEILDLKHLSLRISTQLCIVRITRNGIRPLNNHASEAGIHSAMIDVEIENNGPIEVLRQQLTEVENFVPLADRLQASGLEHAKAY